MLEKVVNKERHRVINRSARPVGKLKGVEKMVSCSFKFGEDKIVFTASKIIGARLSPLDAIYQSRSDRKVRAILSFSDHPAHRLFECLPSGRRFRSIPAKTDRFRDSFYVRAVRGARPLRRQEPLA